MKINLDNFILEVYDETNIEYKSVFVELSNDLSVQKYMGDPFYLIEMFKKEKMKYEAYIAIYNDNKIGFIILNERDNSGKKSYEITYAILEKYRKNYLGSLLVKEFSEKMFELHPYIDKLTAFINPKNIASQKLINLIGYEKENNIKYTKKRL